MKCKNCGFENKNTAKFCSRCGESLEVSSPQEPVVPTKNDNSKVIVIALLIIIIILVGAIGFFVYTNSNSQAQSGTSNSDSGSDDDSSQESPSTQPAPTKPKQWRLIGSYSGSGSGSQGVSVPPGKIMIKISAYPIKNYATNHLYVNGPNGESVGVDWGSTSAVETRSNSITVTTTSTETFTIDYYETVNWKVDFYRYE